MMYVSLARGKAHLAMDHDEDDELITAYIAAASGAVKDYLKSASPYDVERDEQDNPILDSSGDPVYVTDSQGNFVVRPVVEAAVLIQLGFLYKDRDQNADGAYEHGFLPKPVTALLYPLRDPALA